MQTLITRYYKGHQTWNVYGILDVFHKFIRKNVAPSAITPSISNRQTLLTDYYAYVPKSEPITNNLRQTLVTDFYKSSKN